MMKRKRSAGFTMIEMLVVIAIIAIIVAFLFPTFNKARENARQGKCASSLTQIVQAVHNFKKDKGRFPKFLVAELASATPIGTFNGKPVYQIKTADGQVTGQPLSSELYPDYINSVDPFICPNDLTRDPLTGTSYRDIASAYGKVNPNNANETPRQILIYSSYAGPVPGDNRFWNYNGYLPGNSDGLQNPITAQPPISPFECFNDTNYINVMSGAGIKTFNKMPRLCNRQSPDYAIVAHCRFHRDKTGNDIVVRLNGTVSKSVRFPKAIPDPNNPTQQIYITEYDWTLQPEQ